MSLFDFKSFKIPKTNIVLEFSVPQLWLIDSKDFIRAEFHVNTEESPFNLELSICNLELFGLYIDGYKIHLALLGFYFHLWFNQKNDL